MIWLDGVLWVLHLVFFALSIFSGDAGMVVVEVVVEVKWYMGNIFFFWWEGWPMGSWENLHQCCIAAHHCIYYTLTST
jgi:hypothetical protein